MIERFDELAHGAHELRVSVDRGNVSLSVAEGEGWSVEWSGSGHVEPLIGREGAVVTIRSHIVPPAGEESRYEHDNAAGVNFGAIAEEIAAETLRWVGGLVGAQPLNLRITVPPGFEAVELRSGTGELVASGVRGRLRLHTGVGRVVARDGRGQLELKTGMGGVEVERFSGSLKATTGKGDVALSDVAGDVQAGTGYGRIHLSAGELAAEEINLKSGYGEISLELPDAASARVNAQTGYGRVRSDFPLVQVGRSGPLSFGAMRMVGGIGEGEPRLTLSLRTGKGDISLRRGARERRPEPAAAQEPPPAQREPAEAPGQAVATDKAPGLAPRRDSVLAVLEALARGEVTPAEAEDLLSHVR